MFDWDDQELANIIWGEGSEADDHIVPYPEDIEKKDLPDYGDNEKKKLNEEDTGSGAAEKNTAISKLFPDGGKQEKSHGLSAPGVAESQLDLPSFAASKTDDNVIDSVAETSQNHHEEKELGELVGNSWSSIGSFDDLDRIFSNDDLDGRASLGSTDELWSPSKDLLCGAAKSPSGALGSTSWDFGPLGNNSSHIEINSGYLQNEYPSTAGGQKTHTISNLSRQTIGSRVEEYTVNTTGLVEEKTGLGINGKTERGSQIAAENIAVSNMSSDKESWSRNQLKHERTTDRITDSRVLRDVYDMWPSSAANVPQFDHRCCPAKVQNYRASVPSQQRSLQKCRPMPYQHFMNPYGSYAYGNVTDQYPVMHVLKPTENEHQSVLSSSEPCPGDVISMNKPVETTAKPTKMTPQEKIEKLRRRQQMRAMLAIQKQQQRLGHSAPSVDYSLSQKSYQEDQVLHTEKTDLEADEILSTLPSYDPGSPKKRDNSCPISEIDDYSAENTVLYQLQDNIARLDMKIRLCIRDSLYRLAQSAAQRHYASDTSSPNRSGACEPDVAKEEISNLDRFAGNASMETDTNRIDRAVAHLLFHRPLKLSDRPAETPESSTSTKVSIEQETAAPSSLPIGFLAKSSENEYDLSPHGPKTPRPFVDSHEEDISNGISQTEMRINPQMKQKIAKNED